MLGLLGAALLALDALIDLVRGVVYLAVGRGFRAFGPFDEALVFLVVAAVVAFFSTLGGMRREDRSLLAGAVLVVVAIAGWLALGFAAGVLPLLAALLILIAGVVFLVAGR